MDFHADAYNVLNHPNPGSVRLAQSGATASAPGAQPDNAFTTSNAGGGFGAITSTVGKQVGLGTNRQMQVSLWLAF